jgi:hypothetical protein
MLLGRCCHDRGIPAGRLVDNKIAMLLKRTTGQERAIPDDRGIMSPSAQIEGEEDKRLGFAKSSKVLQNPQQNSNKE